MCLALRRDMVLYNPFFFIIFFSFLFTQNCLIKAKESFSGLHMWDGNIIKT